MLDQVIKDNYNKPYRAAWDVTLHTTALDALVANSLIVAEYIRLEYRAMRRNKGPLQLSKCKAPIRNCTFVHNTLGLLQEIFYPQQMPKLMRHSAYWSLGSLG